jgi:transcriptional regulator with XRE-family HTH domain
LAARQCPLDVPTTKVVLVASQVTRSLGTALRRAREELGLSLRDASRRSGGRFTASGIAGYERGERRISVERLCELAEIYGVPPDRLLTDAMRPAGTAPTRIDLSAVDSLSPDIRHLIADRIAEVLTTGVGEPVPDRISLRLGDLEILAGTTGSPAEVMHRIIEAVVQEGVANDAANNDPASEGRAG